jgi:protein-L-isoaspartate(D-aspartate) O-methyltransferase
VLCEIVDSVFTVEIVGALYELSTNRLEDLGYNNVITKHGDGYFGWPEKGPFDAIVVTAAAEFIPPPLTEQLKPGGKMIIPVGSPFLVQQLILVEKSGSKLKTRKLMPVKFVPFTRSPED